MIIQQVTLLIAQYSDSSISTLYCGFSSQLIQMLEGQLNEQLLKTVTDELRETLWSLQFWMIGPMGKKADNLIRTLQVCCVAYIFAVQQLFLKGNAIL